MCSRLHNADPTPAWVTACYTIFKLSRNPTNLPNLLFNFCWFFSAEPAWPINTLNDSRMTSELGQTWHSLNSKSVYFEVKSEILSKCQHALLIYVYVMISTILTLLLKNIWTWSVLSYTHLLIVSKCAKSMEIVSNRLPTKIEPEVTTFTQKYLCQKSIYLLDFTRIENYWILQN